MEIREEEIRRLEVLAALHLEPGERAKLRSQLGRILDYVRQLERIDLEEVPATTELLPSIRSLRADASQPSQSRDTMLSNAPERRDGFYGVPRFVGEEEDG